MTEPSEKDRDRIYTELKTKRASMQGFITRHKNYIETNAESMNMFDFETRLGLLESYFQQFLDLQSEMERLTEDCAAEDIKREEVEKSYCTAKSKILCHIAKFKARRSIANVLDTTTSRIVRLPKLQLPHFSGNLTEWLDFYGTFTKLVHDDPELTEIEKFQHLRSCLGERPLRTIKALETTDSNYAKALSLLKSRYDNTAIIFQAHIKELFELPRLKSTSSSHLRDLVDSVNAHLRALNSFGNAQDILGGILLHLVSSKLDIDTQIKWEDEITLEKLPSWDSFEKFLNNRCINLENRDINSRHNASSISFSKALKAIPSKRNASFLSASKGSCRCCKGNCLFMVKCQRFLKMSPRERYFETKRLSLCLLCLNKGHSIKTCASPKCSKCDQPHHILLHRAENTDSIKAGENQQISNLAEPNKAAASTSKEYSGSYLTEISKVSSSHSAQSKPANGGSDYILLATAVVEVKDRFGTFLPCRALLDSASQLNFITERMTQLLNLKRERHNVEVNGIGKISTQLRNKTTTTIKSRLNEYSTCLELCILPNITDFQPHFTLDIENWGVPKNIKLADPLFNKPQRIDLLIGAGLFFELLVVGQIRLGNNLPLLQKTLLGWVVTGEINEENRDIGKRRRNSLQVLKEGICEDESLGKLLERFWLIESVSPSSRIISKEHKECERHYLENFSRTSNGQYMVRLPFHKDPSLLGESFEIAKRRFYNLERKLNKQPELKVQYASFIHEYANLGHMERIQKSEIADINYFLPHHCVLRPDSSSTSLRVVFDGSCHTTSGFSLNDIMMVGPIVQPELFDIVVRFRFHRYVVTADISKMFRQILVSPRDTNLQCIVWRDNSFDDLEIYRLKTVTYGTAAAPFLSTRCLLHLADSNSKGFPVGSRVLKNDFYVDDMLAGANTIEEAIQIRAETNELLSKAQLQLRKWSSNDPSILNGIPEDNREKLRKVNGSDVTKTLGLFWEPHNDQFLFYNLPKDNSFLVSKRTVLSEIARFYDPLGLLNPVIVLAKILLQQLWKLKLNWDESLPAHLHTWWARYRSQLKLINDFKIPRFVLPIEEVVNMQFHGFSDASEQAYGCCIYVRTEDIKQNVKISLLCAKSRVAPVKTQTLPKLELCGALLLAELLSRVVKTTNFQDASIYCWTDSTIVLDWLAGDASTYPTFIANRIARIQEMTSTFIWKHVRSKDNPADLVSRGTLPENLLQSHIWFNGPEYLLQMPKLWPRRNHSYYSSIDNPEQIKAKTTKTTNIKSQDFLATMKFLNDFPRLRRIFGYILRFITNCKRRICKKEKMKGMISADELDTAVLRMVAIVQKQEFTEDFEHLERFSTVSSRSRLRSLCPFMDKQSEFQLIRVGGRLRHSDLPYSVKYPVLLPRKHSFVLSLINYYHIKNLHAGPQALIAFIRQRFWLINARSIARQVVHRCIRCFRSRPQMFQQVMGNLPPHRLQPSRPFTNSGVDFCGPFWAHYRIRGKRPYKVYVAVFICFATKAVHMELVSDLSTGAFIAALKRFIARRGYCKTLYCDNATNFVGARRELSELQKQLNSQQSKELIMTYCSENGIEFRHIPPRSPHFGGLWEAAVKSAKTHLVRTVNGASLSYEELLTIVTQIEAVLNSRPLTAMSSDPADLEALTPGHFLIGSPLNSIAEPNLMEENINRLSRWQQIRALQQGFWSRWSKEYITSLQQKLKWNSKSSDVKIGSLVLVSDENLPPQRWLLGRIVHTYPGSDGIVRVVLLKTKNGEIKRAVQKLCPLPIDDVHDEENKG